ncbi:hypothetical protein MNBD_GAMMA11-1962 [hydrothermal vent metagenome]|uniref:Uncharacterized protein n=1 Tax=hydrothermal vent metagenome TaxID=652676 RepID=A0A3B0WV79_9ZZZZ
MTDKKDIPTLTNIVHTGDDSMRNHFDAHQLSDDENEEPHLTENATEFENIEFENAEIEKIEIEGSEPADIPFVIADNDDTADDILFDDDSIDIYTDSLSDEELPYSPDELESTPDSDNIEENTAEESTDNENNTLRSPQKEAIQKKIDEAIADAIPWIELNLKKQLYKKFDI